MNIYIKLPYDIQDKIIEKIYIQHNKIVNRCVQHIPYYKNLIIGSRYFFCRSNPYFDIKKQFIPSNIKQLELYYKYNIKYSTPNIYYPKNIYSQRLLHSCLLL